MGSRKVCRRSTTTVSAMMIRGSAAMSRATRSASRTYSYAANNPVNLTDPSGRVPVALPVIALALRAAWPGSADAPGPCSKIVPSNDMAPYLAIADGGLLRFGAMALLELAGRSVAAEEAGTLELGTAKSWGNPSTLADHFARHGADFAATSEARVIG
jgi:hypothetical protein